MKIELEIPKEYEKRIKLEILTNEAKSVAAKFKLSKDDINELSERTKYKWAKKLGLI